MSDIFVSYASQDRDRVRPLVDALTATGWSIFWDRSTPVGKTWPEFISGEVDDCRTMVVVWSTASVTSDWVREEVAEGKRRRILFPVLLDPVTPPFGFRSIQAADLVGKSGAEFDAVVQHLVEELGGVLGPPPAGTARERQELAERERLRELAENERLRELAENERLRELAEREEARELAERELARELAERKQRELAERKRRELDQHERLRELAEPEQPRELGEREQNEHPSPDPPPVTRRGKWALIAAATTAIALLVGLAPDSTPLADTATPEPSPTLGANPTPEEPDPPEEQTITVHGVELVLIPGGEFMMGSPSDETDRDSDEGPQHEVKLDAFYMARTPVTNAQYAEYLKDRPDTVKHRYWDNAWYNQPEQPVVGVSWDEAQAYCDWAGLVLPTEAQWEYTARAGTTTRYWAGDTEEDLARVGWYAGNSERRLHAVKELAANPFGLYDVHGNVWEWCLDSYDDYETSPRPVDGLRRKPAGDANRVIRGGSWGNVARNARSADRGNWQPGIRDFIVGFRPAQAYP